ncbi:MAG: phosphoethanolamine--lipid A transferase [Burkholderiales bacterium]|nr:phosphoethanolamine--lipid A transferase [Burkholderiales bacterium]
MARLSLSTTNLILVVTAFLLIFGNTTLASNILKAYPVNGDNIFSLLSLIIVFGGATILLLALMCFRHSTKPVLIIVLLLSSMATYFMDSYGVVISDDMMRNIAYTSTAETLELLNIKLLAYLTALGVVPAILVGMVPLQWRGLRREIIARLKLLGITTFLVVATTLAFGSFYASFFREHKELRQHANPTYYFYSAIKYATQLLKPASNAPIVTVGADAVIPASDVDRELTIMVVGETARADRFSLNGYQRDTNPQLQKLNVVNFTNFRACGTSTAVSVPCMFLLDGQANAASSKIATDENLLDVLKRSGVAVLWRDNNSDSKGVAERVTFQDYKSPKTNTICDIECRDEGMLVGLQEFIDSHPTGDVFIVLHQMGNHGPAYFRRYPPEFERFKPACKDSDLSRCSREEIGNAYDNAILYTDHFLAKIIGLLRKNDNKFETALFYVSDHGESLGENGLYLHGLPKAIAPDTQLHIPALMWFGANFRDANIPALRAKTGERFTHSNVFHTLLGIFEVETSVYRPRMDMLDSARPSGQKK